MSGAVGFDSDEVKLILASLVMMARLTSEDASIPAGEKNKLERVANSIREKFKRAILGSGLEIILPDEFIPPPDLN